ncbi:reverse transcriptase domain-containing protein, partial [Tanacetum coccineum]
MDDLLRQLLIQNQNLKRDQEATNQFVQTQIAGPSVPSPPSPKEVERYSESTTDQVLTESTTRVPPLVVQPSPAFTSSELPPTPISYPVIPEQNLHQPPIPYPSSFAEALAHMPKFAKMVKDLLTNKKNFLNWKILPWMRTAQLCSSKSYLKNLETLGGFSFHTLSLPELTPTRMTLKLATRTVAYPAGITEDVFIQVGKFTFPTDFVIVDLDIDPWVPLILGRSFLRTAHALVDVHGEELSLRVG